MTDKQPELRDYTPPDNDSVEPVLAALGGLRRYLESLVSAWSMPNAQLDERLIEVVECLEQNGYNSGVFVAQRLSSMMIYTNRYRREGRKADITLLVVYSRFDYAVLEAILVGGKRRDEGGNQIGAPLC